MLDPKKRSRRTKSLRTEYTFNPLRRLSIDEEIIAEFKRDHHRFLYIPDICTLIASSKFPEGEFATETRNNVQWRIIAPDDIPQQMNQNDCGPFLCYFLGSFHFDNLIPKNLVSSDNMAQFRENLAVCITSMFNEWEHHPMSVDDWIDANGVIDLT